MDYLNVCVLAFVFVVFVMCCVRWINYLGGLNTMKMIMMVMT